MKRLVIAALAGLVTACGPVPKPVVDMKSVSDPQAYQKDLIECVTLADYYLTSERRATMNVLAGGVATGAAAGVGAAAFGPSSGSIGADMATGFVGGTIAGMIQEPAEQELDRNAGAGRCLENRGYEILNAKQVFLTPRRWCALAQVRTQSLLERSDKALDQCAAAEEERQKRLKEQREARLKAAQN